MKTQIFLVFVFEKKRLRYFTGKRIEPKYWDFVRQRVKPSYPNYGSLNLVLNTLSTHLEQEYNKLLVIGKKITTDGLKKILDERLNKVEYSESLFKYLDEFTILR